MDFETIRRDIAAFADEEEAVVLEQGTGELLFRRLGVEFDCRLRQDPTAGYYVECAGQTLPYRTFLAREVARLDVLAERIKVKRQSLVNTAGTSSFVNGPAELDRATSGSASGKAVNLLDELCVNPPFASTRVVFVTADAGYGKTALLREYQRTQADRFLAREADYLFWHVDLQGRQLVRLSEALMGDLGELRVVGIYMASVVALIRHGLLVLAIDGFDELAAEQGSTEALGALAHLLEQLSGGGTVVAASRRTFFSADDYLEGARLLGTRVAPFCEFDHLRLLEWTASEAHELLAAQGFPDPAATYNKLALALGEVAGPVLSTPFLLAQTAKALKDYDLDPEQWVEGMGGGAGGVAGMVEAFLRREVVEKWKTNEGASLLTFDQHMQLLATIAEEMWMSQTEKLDIETIHVLADILFEDWRLQHEIRMNLMEMLRMHVFLMAAYEASEESRSFTHPEYQRFFEARALYEYLEAATQRELTSPLARFLGTAQLPDVVATHVARMARSSQLDVGRIVDVLTSMASAIWKPSGLQVSIGTLLPQLLSGVDAGGCVVDARAVYPRMALEGTRLRNVVFMNGQFARSSLRNVHWQNVQLVNCHLIELVIENSTFEDVLLKDCSIAGATVRWDGEERTEYAPGRVQYLLQSVNIQVQHSGKTRALHGQEDMRETVGRKALEKILRTYRRTTALTENLVQQRFGREHAFVVDKVLPLMEEFGIVERGTWEGHGTRQGRWLLRRTREEILQSASSDSALAEFWNQLDALHA